MAKLLVLDFETTGKDPKECHPIEFASVYYDTGTKKRSNPFTTLIYQEDYPEITKEIEELTGIDEPMLQTYGVSVVNALSRIKPIVDKAEILVAYNAPYDSTILNRLYQSFGHALPKAPWLCAMMDVPYPERASRCRQLGHRALDLGLPMDTRERHRAMADVDLVCEIFDLYDMAQVLEWWQMPSVVIAAKIPKPWDDGGKGKDAAKAAGFGWETCSGTDAPKFSQRWVKKIKQALIESAEFPFPVEVVG